MALGIAFAGGGTRGSYHLGAYQAITELGKHPDMVVGTSIGAINAALIAQGDFERLCDLWNGIKMSDILDISNKLGGTENLFDIKNTSALIKEIYRNKGLDVTPLRELIESVIDEEKLKDSNIDFGLVTFSVTDKKETTVTKKQIPDGLLTDYLLASACFLGFKPVQIGNAKFVDGAVSNNMPVNMLIENDIEDIIAIDVGGVGIVKNTNNSGRNIITVRAKEPAVGILDFNSEDIEKNRQFGYFDTLKAFGKCVGYKYYVESASYYDARMRYSEEIILGIENAAEILGIERFKIYSMHNLIRAVLSEYIKQPKNEGIIEKIINSGEKGITCALADAIINKNYDFLGNKIVLGLLGPRYDAASAIAYFSKHTFEI